MVHKIKQRLKTNYSYWSNDLKKRAGLFNSQQLPPTGSRILVYHGIDRADERKFNTRFISQRRLALQLNYFKQYFNLVSLSDLLEQRVDENAFNLAITFDDGYRNHLTYALPVLKRLRVPATFCVTAISHTPLPLLWTDYLDIAATVSKKAIIIDGKTYTARRAYPWSNLEYTNRYGERLKVIAKCTDQIFKEKLLAQLQQHISLADLAAYALYWQQLTKQEIQTLAASPFAEVASHGYYHNNLGEIPRAAAQWEMRASKHYLEEATQQRITTIAYPDGSYNEQLVAYGKAIGYDHHLITGYQTTTDRRNPLLTDRLTINPYISAHNQLLAIANGKYYE